MKKLASKAKIAVQLLFYFISIYYILWYFSSIWKFSQLALEFCLNEMKFIADPIILYYLHTSISSHGTKIIVDTYASLLSIIVFFIFPARGPFLLQFASRIFSAEPSSDNRRLKSLYLRSISLSE